jgi:hypothetical protein
MDKARSQRPANLNACFRHYDKAVLTWPVRKSVFADSNQRVMMLLHRMLRNRTSEHAASFHMDRLITGVRNPQLYTHAFREFAKSAWDSKPFL